MADSAKPDQGRFEEVAFEIEDVIKHVTLKHVSRKDLRRLKVLNYPVEGLLSKDPVRAQKAAQRFARLYFFGK